MTKAEKREVILETLQYELLERFDTNIEYYNDEVAEIEVALSLLDETIPYDYLQDLIDNNLDFSIKKYSSPLFYLRGS